MLVGCYIWEGSFTYSAALAPTGHLLLLLVVLKRIRTSARCMVSHLLFAVVLIVVLVLVLVLVLGLLWNA